MQHTKYFYDLTLASRLFLWSTYYNFWQRATSLKLLIDPDLETLVDSGDFSLNSTIFYQWLTLYVSSMLRVVNYDYTLWQFHYFLSMTDTVCLINVVSTGYNYGHTLWHIDYEIYILQKFCSSLWIMAVINHFRDSEHI